MLHQPPYHQSSLHQLTTCKRRIIIWQPPQAPRSVLISCLQHPFSLFNVLSRNSVAHSRDEVTHSLSEAQHSRCIAAHSFHKRRSTNCQPRKRLMSPPAKPGLPLAKLGLPTRSMITRCSEAPISPYSNLVLFNYQCIIMVVI